MPTQRAEAEWKGNLMEGSGRLKAGSGAFDGPYSFESRLEEGQAAPRHNARIFQATSTRRNLSNLLRPFVISRSPVRLRRVALGIAGLEIANRWLPR
jgi:hypothetical protein